MHFKGQLLLPGDPGPGLRVDLDVAAHHLAVESDGGGLGAWPLETVAVERLQGDVFALTVAGESLRFVADDTIAFTYSGVPTIERVSRRPKARSVFRSMLDKVWNGPEKPASPDPAESAPSESIEPESGEYEIAQEAAEATEDPTAGALGELDTPAMVVDEVVELAEEAGATDTASEVLEHISIPLMEIDDLVGVGDNTIASSPPVAPESPPASEVSSDSVGCPAVRSDGRRCESPILTSSGYCYPHDPRRALEDTYQSAQEARARLKRDATERLNRIYARLDKALRQVERGDLDPETAMAMAQLARTMCAILDMDDSPTGDNQ